MIWEKEILAKLKDIEWPDRDIDIRWEAKWSSYLLLLCPIYLISYWREGKGGGRGDVEDVKKRKFGTGQKGNRHFRATIKYTTKHSKKNLESCRFYDNCIYIYIWLRFICVCLCHSTALCAHLFLLVLYILLCIDRNLAGSRSIRYFAMYSRLTADERKHQKVKEKFIEKKNKRI